MREGIDKGEDVRSYLGKSGWTSDQRGTSGELWRHQTETGEGVVLAVPSTIAVGSTEWHAIVDRIARFENRSSLQIAFALEHLYVDVARFRAANEFVIDQSIPLIAGVGLVSTAYKILRASATTARQARAQIGGNFSTLGDEIAKRARLGHTEEGSYILPVLMPLSVDEVDHAGGFWEDQPGVIGRVALETSERRVTRTMAEALATLLRVVIDPAKEPNSGIVAPLVAAGVSRELVVAVEQVLEDPAVADFETGFSWAPGITAPAGVPERVSIPSEARYLLTKAATLLKTTTRDPAERATGPIVQIRHLPNDLFGEVGLQTMRHGRNAEIRVRVAQERIEQLLEWMKTSRTVVVEGLLIRDPGKPLKIDNPTQIYPLDESLLFTI
jgi:hypothetical protein